MQLNLELMPHIVRVILPLSYETHQGNRIEFFGNIEIREIGRKTFYEVARGGQAVLFAEEAIVKQSLLTKTIILQDGEHVVYALAPYRPKFGPTWS